MTTAPVPARSRRPGRPRASRWPRPLRWAAWVAGALALVLVVVAVLAVVLVRRPLPQVDGTLAVEGLEAPVRVLRDAQGVPQLYGSSDADLVRAQGFVHAQDRFYEMDVRRHATAGRLAELFGEPALASDRVVRTMGWRRVAEQEVALVEPRTRALFQAYADGVNAYLAERGTSRLSLAYTILGLGGLDYRPEPWSVADSLAWLKAMAWDLRGNMADELDRALAASAVGEERAAQLWPAYPEENAPIVTGGAVVDGVFEPAATTGGTRLPQRAAPFAGDPAGARALRSTLGAVRDGVDAVPAWFGRGSGLGSNSWVVSGDRTSTGEPLLANDPHLGVGVPGVWTQVGLHCTEASPDCTLDVSGFSFSGVPGVIIGHNADIAWGFTNLGPDVTDLYLERVRDDTVRRGRDYEPLTTRTEVLRVAGGDDVELEVRESRHGPLLSDVDAGTGALADQQADDAPAAWAGDELAVALSWTALRPGTTADAVLALDSARDWDDFRAAASRFEVPAQNLVYADTEGRIGYQAPGRVPVRRSGNDGRTPALGWRPADDWSDDVVPFDALPRVVDPEEGFVVTANQQVISPEGYPWFLTSDWDRGYRSQRIRERLEAELADGGTITPGEMAAVQRESRNPMAAVLLPHLLRAELPAGYASAGQQVLEEWDGQQDAESAGAAYFNATWSHLLELTFHDELPEALWPDGGDRWFGVVTALLEDPADPWWDDVTTDRVETRDDVVEQAMLDARDEVRRLMGRSPSDWHWGRLHRLDLEEASLGGSGIGLLERIFNRGGWEVGGSSAAVDATSWYAPDGYGVTAAPSMRMVVDLADLDASRWVNLTGVSGHPFSGHYTDQTDTWARGETYPWPATPDAVEAATEHTLTLEPADD